MSVWHFGEEAFDERFAQDATGGGRERRRDGEMERGKGDGETKRLKAGDAERREAGEVALAKSLTDNPTAHRICSPCRVGRSWLCGRVIDGC